MTTEGRRLVAETVQYLDHRVPPCSRALSKIEIDSANVHEFCWLLGSLRPECPRK